MREQADELPRVESLDLPPGEHVIAASNAFALLADPTRLRLLWLLSSGIFDVGSLASMVGATPAATSQHLAKLRLAGLVTTRAVGRRRLYEARGGHVKRLINEALNHANHTVHGLDDHD